MKSCFRNDAMRKVCGEAKFGDDFRFHGMVHAVPVYTEYIHAENLSLEIEDARSMPGVLSVFTWEDVPGELTAGQINQDYPIFVKDRIRSNSDVAALVVAETRMQALAAAEKVIVTADVLAAVLDPEEALKKDAPVIPEGKDSNLVNHHIVRTGDPDTALAMSSVVIEQRFETPFVEHAYLEPECAVCVPREDGGLEIYGSMQHPFSTRRFVCAYLGRPLASVVCLSHAVGGSFGGKDDTASVVCARAALAALKLNRPVKLLLKREWSMRESYKRVPYKMDYKVGFDGDGHLTGAISKTLADSGAYTSTTPWSTWRSTVQNMGPYKLENIRGEVLGVATNNVFTGAFRGFGSPQTNFAVEQIMDMAAEKLGLTPLEIRKRNALVQDSITITGQKLDNHTVSLMEVMEKTAETIDFERKYRNSSRGKGGKFYGIGMAASYRGCSVGAEAMDFCCATINIQFDGSILLDTAVFENGQGAVSAMMLICAEELGVPVESIHYQASSTASIPDGGTTVASRGTLVGGGAIKDAMSKLKPILQEILYPEIAESPDQVSFHDNRIWGTEERSLTWSEAGHQMYLSRVYPFAFGSFQAPRVSWDEENGQGNAYFSYVYSCQAVEVEVDPEKRSCRLLNVVATHDIGKAINPPMVEGQIQGGIVQGMGMALTEDFKIEEGRIKSLNFSKYKIPRMTDVPDMLTQIVENHDPLSPTGAKGIGEPAMEIIAPAIANAVAAATGERFFSLPIKLKKEIQA